VEAYNLEHQERDHEKLRAAMVRIVRETGQRILVCPEMTYQIDIADELLIGPLPSDVKEKVVKRKTFWQVDEASSVYKRASAVLSLECHSPILALSHGTPCIHVRYPCDSVKGQMFKDIGLGRWLIEIDDASGSDVADAAIQILGHRRWAKDQVAEAMEVVAERRKAAMKALAACMQSRHVEQVQ